jgi:hypothetical protein
MLLVAARVSDVLEATGLASPGERRLGPHPELFVGELGLAKVHSRTHPLDVVGGVGQSWAWHEGWKKTQQNKRNPNQPGTIASSDIVLNIVGCSVITQAVTAQRSRCNKRREKTSELALKGLGKD